MGRKKTSEKQAADEGVVTLSARIPRSLQMVIEVTASATGRAHQDVIRSLIEMHRDNPDALLAYFEKKIADLKKKLKKK